MREIKRTSSFLAVTGLTFTSEIRAADKPNRATGYFLTFLD